MAKIVLGKRPKNFKHTVTVDLPEGGKGSVEWSFIYRTRTEFGEFIDALFSSSGVERGEDIEFSLREALEKSKDTNADYLMKIADGWNLESPFTRESVSQLCDELPGAALATINDYRAACTEGRLGN